MNYFLDARLHKAVVVETLLHIKSCTPLVFVLISLSISSVTGQNFRHFSEEEESSPRGVILDITQDSEGFMWFASPAGVYRYDGRRFTKHGRSPTDSNSTSRLYVQSVRSDSKGNLWAGALDGLYRYDREKDTFSAAARHSPPDSNSLSHDRVYTVFEDSRKRLWVGTASGLDLVTSIDGKVIVSRKLPPSFTADSRAVRSIAEDRDGTLWLGTYDGLIRFRGENDAKLFKRTSKVPSTVLNEFVEVFVDKNGEVWVGSNEPGLVRFDKVHETFTTVESFRDPIGRLPVVNKISVDSKGRHWMATESGLALYDTVKNTGLWYTWDPKDPYSLSDNVLFSQFIDNQGGLWLGSYYWGINYWHPDSPVFSIWPTETHGIPYEDFFNGWIGAGPDGRSWALSNGLRKLIVVDNASEQSRLYNLPIPTPEIYRVFMLDTDGFFWCAGFGGVCRVDLKRNRTKFFHLSQTKGKANRMIKDRSGVVWLAGSFGLRKLNKANGSFETVSSIRNEVKGIFEDSQKKIWASTKNTVFRISPDGTLLDSCKTDDYLNKFVEDSQGNVWSVVNRGLVKFDSKNAHLAFEKILSGEFSGIEIDKNDFLWLPENTRLKRFDPGKKTVQTFGYREGLPSNSLFGYADSFEDRESRLYFNTTHEIFRFDPTSIKNIDSQAPVVLTSLKLFNKPVNIGDKTGILEKSLHRSRSLRFRHDQNVFSLEFSLLSFFKSEANQFAYQLKGFDKDWNFVSKATATYTNLPPGTYTFLAKAANGDGVWSSKPLELEIVILPPWWKTWYAYLFYLFLMILLIYGITRFFWLRSLVRKENEVYQSKLDFFTNISHEIRTHLALISSPLESAFRAPEVADHTKRLLTYAKNNSDRLLALVGELLDFRKIQNGKVKLWIAEYDVINTLKSVIAAFEHQAAQKDLTVELIAPQTPVLLWVDIAQIQKVFYNLVSNAFKFTPEGGKITISISEGSDEVRVEFKDNGKGIAPAYLENLFSNFYQVYEHNQDNTGYGIGLALSKEIVLRHHGDLSVTSRLASRDRPGETCFTLRLLKGNLQFEHDQMVERANPALLTPALEQVASKHADDSGEAVKNDLSSILLIEDNDELRSFGVETLRERHTVMEASDGKTGLKLAKENIPDIIVCDVMMPEMNGLEVCKRLKEDFNTRHIPVILISARSTSSQMIEGLSSGAADYLIKPFNFDVLELKIQNLIRSREISRQQYSKVISLEPGEVILKDLDAEFLTKLRDLVLKNLADSKIGVDEIAFHLGTSVSVLYRKLRALTGMTVNEFIKSIRMKTALRLLSSGQYNVSEVSGMIGFDDVKYFSKEFKKVYDKNPNEIRKQAVEEKGDKKSNF